MNQLDPQLKRLMVWARHAERRKSHGDQAPRGFAGRVVSSWGSVPPRSLLSDLTQLAWIACSIALVVIVVGSSVLVHNTRHPELTGSLPSALNFAASQFTP